MRMHDARGRPRSQPKGYVKMERRFSSVPEGRIEKSISLSLSLALFFSCSLFRVASVIRCPQLVEEWKRAPGDGPVDPAGPADASQDAGEADVGQPAEAPNVGPPVVGCPDVSREGDRSRRSAATRDWKNDLHQLESLFSRVFLLPRPPQVDAGISFDNLVRYHKGKFFVRSSSKTCAVGQVDVSFDLAVCLRDALGRTFFAIVFESFPKRTAMLILSLVGSAPVIV